MASVSERFFEKLKDIEIEKNPVCVYEVLGKHCRCSNEDKTKIFIQGLNKNQLRKYAFKYLQIRETDTY